MKVGNVWELTSSKGVVNIMKGDCCYWIDHLNTVLLETVTLEGILLLLNFWAWVQVFNSHTTLNGAQHVGLHSNIYDQTNASKKSPTFVASTNKFTLCLLCAQEL